MPGGEIPQNVSIGAAIEFFLNHIPLEHGKVKHIVIAAHTDCGGLKACQHGGYGDQDHHLPLYLESLKEVRTKVMDDANSNGWDNAQVLDALEKESVRQSMANLLSYPVVRNAIDQGKLELHGWIIDTTTQHISEMNLQTLGFASMSAKLEQLPGRHRRQTARDDRPGLKLCLEFLRPEDVLVVWKLDRLGRSLPHLIEIVGSSLRLAPCRVPLAYGIDRYDDGDGGISVSRLRSSGPI